MANRICSKTYTGIGVALLVFWGVAVAGGESRRVEDPRVGDGKIAYSIIIDRGDCGRVLDCVDSKVRLAEIRSKRAITVGGCASRDCDDGSPAWSPDGRTLLFSRSQAGQADNLTSSPRGTSLREVPGGTAATFAPSGRRLAFQSLVRLSNDTGRARFELFVGSLAEGPDASRRRRTFRGADLPSWSSRGRIAFSRLRRNATHDIFTIDPDHGRASRLTRRGGTDPDWSPDGRRLVFLRGFVRGDFKVDDLVVIGARGGKVTRLTRGGAQSPAWSPSGREIAFVRGRRILALNLRTTKLRELARVKRGRAIGSVDWQPRP